MGPKALLVVVLVCMGVLSAEGLKCYMGHEKTEQDCSKLPGASADTHKSCQYFKEGAKYRNGACWLVSKSGCEPPVAGIETCYCDTDLCNSGAADAFKNSMPVLALVAIFTTVATLLC